MDIWTAKAESGLTLAKDSRSVERTKKFPWNVWMDRPEGDGNAEAKSWPSPPPQESVKTFSASYSHDRLKADLPGEVTLQIPLELLQLGRIVDEVEGRVVKDAASRVPGDTGWGGGGRGCQSSG